MTFLQLATVYGALDASPRSRSRGEDAKGDEGEDLGGVAVGWFASGTGAAGIGGAGLWWVVRGLGIRGGLGVCMVRCGSPRPASGARSGTSADVARGMRTGPAAVHGRKLLPPPPAALGIGAQEAFCRQQLVLALRASATWRL